MLVLMVASRPLPVGLVLGTSILPFELQATPLVAIGDTDIRNAFTRQSKRSFANETLQSGGAKQTHSGF